MSAVTEPQPTTASVRRTGALVLNSLGALLVAAAATVFTVIAWEQLRLPGKVAVVGGISVGALAAGHGLRHRLPGLAGVLTHLGAVLAPLAAGAGAVVFEADRSTAAVIGGVTGATVLWLADRFRSPLLATGRAFALGGIAVGVGAWLDVPTSILLVALAAGAVTLSRWDEAMTLAVLSACGPLLRWSTSFADDGSLLVWMADLTALSAPWAVAIASGAAIVTASVIVLLPAAQTIRTRVAMSLLTTIIAVNAGELIETALTAPGVLAAALAAASTVAFVGRSVRQGWLGTTLGVLALACAAATSGMTPPIVAVLVVAVAGHAIRRLDAGGTPRSAQSVLMVMLAAVSAALLAHGSFQSVDVVTAWMPTAALLVAGLATSRLVSVPDLVAAPRLALAVPILATTSDLRLSGALALVSGIALLVEALVDQRREYEPYALILVIAGSWMLAGSWSIEPLEAYAIGPAVAAAWLGWRVVSAGGSSWIGLAPAVAFITGAGLIERMTGGNGWHAVGVGVAAVVALAVSVTARWRGPSVIAVLALAGIVVLETAAFVPAVPVWIWLGVGGCSLLAIGALLEGRAGEGDAVSLRGAWAAFR